ncbi:MAG: HAMP domain-containing histidine kinase [Betaproteobacteria bacterium]|nr:HAMP domain-containing histidine kinase [Betaproteobacteria bacterium]
MPPTPKNDAELRQAFALFSETSEKLAETYLELQSQVARLTSELAAANGELARRERLSALGEMAAQVAHQLRTPLATALLYAGHLAKPDLGEADRMRFSQKVLSRLRYLERLIQDMLLFVKGARVSPEPFPISALADEIVQTIEPQASAKGIRFRHNAPPEDLMLSGDRQAISGAVINLLENAIQACPADGEVDFLVGGQGSPFASFRVEDTGQGVPESVRDRLFDPFFTTRSEGSGLGLAIVRQVAEAHGGWVEWTPREEGGSRFTLLLPIAKPDAPIVPDLHGY